MFSTLALILALGTTTAHVVHHHPGHRHVVHKPAQRPKPPPRTPHAHHVYHHRGHWVYPHSNPAFIWKWVPGYHNRRGEWISAHWRVVIRF